MHRGWAADSRYIPTPVYRKQVRRRRLILAALVILSFVLLTVTFGQSSNPLQRGLSAAFGPLEDGATRALKPAQDLINWFDETFEARGENERLRAELGKARELAVSGQAAIQENDQLRALFGLKRSGVLPTRNGLVTARVIARSPTNWTSVVAINAGTDDGVAELDPVISGVGLVGQVISATSSAAQVRLITDPESRVTAKVVPSGAQGILEPEIGDPETLILSFLDRDARIRRGEQVVTSGWQSGELESRFPPNVPVGEVSRTPLVEQEGSEQVFVTPFADMSRLDIVQVLTASER